MFSKRLLLNSAAFLAGTLFASTGFSQGAVAAGDEGGRKPRIDLAFCIDTTGSMQNEIDAVKTKTKEIVARLSGSKPTPNIRVGIVAYRDRGDEYVTRVFQFSDNIDQVVKDISSLKADGGGDEPESVNEALHVSVNDLSWSKDNKTVKLLFLIGDAGPHYYPGDYSWETESRNAIAKGVQINTIACDGLKPDGLAVFQKIARLADGKCEALTYRQEVVNAAGHRSTLVSSAGKMYRVEGSSADAWRSGADKLVAKGAAVPLAGAGTASYSDSGAVVPPSMAFASAGPERDMKAAPAAMKMSSARRAYAGSGGGAGAVASVSRGDSNLEDIVLSATKDAARKKANIDYKD